MQFTISVSDKYAFTGAGVRLNNPITANLLDWKTTPDMLKELVAIYPAGTPLAFMYSGPIPTYMQTPFNVSEGLVEYVQRAYAAHLQTARAEKIALASELFASLLNVLAYDIKKEELTPIIAAMDAVKKTL